MTAVFHLGAVAFTTNTFLSYTPSYLIVGHIKTLRNRVQSGFQRRLELSESVVGIFHTQADALRTKIKALRSTEDGLKQQSAMECDELAKRLESNSQTEEELRTRVGEMDSANEALESQRREAGETLQAVRTS
jgi:hypothetical protein